jgi:hypothetical protein
VTRLAGAIAIASACTLFTACSRDSEDAKPRTVTFDPSAARRAYLDGSAATPAVANAQNSRPDPGWPSTADAGSRQTFQVMLTKSVTTEAGAPKRVNPDDAILERARVAAGGCFRSIPGYVPQRSAHIALTVIPSGTVSRADVSSPDTTDEGVLGCIQQQALGTHFSDNADGPLRTYAIDVQVIAK